MDYIENQCAKQLPDCSYSQAEPQASYMNKYMQADVDDPYKKYRIRIWPYSLEW